VAKKVAKLARLSVLIGKRKLRRRITNFNRHREWVSSSNL
jgi:hypothetical protein